MPSPEAPRVSPDDIVRAGLCIGCGACAAGQPGAAMRLDAYGQFKPEGPKPWRRSRSEAFSALCPFSPAAANEDEIAATQFPAAPHHDPRLGRFQANYVGHAAEGDFRPQGSSGGMVSWTAAELLRRGLVDAVVHVAPTEGADGDPAFFRYRISRSEPELRAGAKSRYHPVELSGALREIAARPGRYALVGAPCFIKAAHLARAQDPILAQRIAFTLGLFCGHMKSLSLVESFAWQMGLTRDEVAAVEYRLKDPTRPASWYTAFLRLKDGQERRKDWWHLADGDWGAGFFQNAACNFCDDVVAETADIAFGDAWVEPYASDGRGTNVVVVRSPVIGQLIEDARTDGRLALEPVDAEFIVQTQAAGFRQRREGLAWRLSWPRLGVRPRKRVRPEAAGLPTRRRAVYLMRHEISAWSHRVRLAAHALAWPQLYIGWAAAMLWLYRALTYSHGRLGRLFDRLEAGFSRRG